jgi:putative phosphoesterase
VRVAALYDIHGNLAALEAVLAEVPSDAVILVGGDVVGGESSSEVVERLRALGERVRWIRGNTERELVERAPPREGGPPPEEMERLRRALTDEQMDLLYGLPEHAVLDVDGIGRVRFCHATPRNDVEIVTIFSPEERLAEVLAGVDEPLVVVGHTHVQDDRRSRGVRFVNAGSVGMPYEDEPGAYWLLLGPEVELRHTSYDGAPAPLAGRREASEYFESLARG